MVWRWSGTLNTGMAASMLFVVFPLFGEPVLWLSSSPDLWACFFALLSLVALDRRRLTVGASIYGMGLLCKESVFALPLVGFLLAPQQQWRRSVTVRMVLVAGSYLLVRLFLFKGMGGYVQDEGHRTFLAPTPTSVVRTLLVNLPFALAVPFKGAYRSWWWIAPLSAVLLGGLWLVTPVLSHRRSLLLRACAVALVALVPRSAGMVVALGRASRLSRALVWAVLTQDLLGLFTGPVLTAKVPKSIDALE